MTRLCLVALAMLSLSPSQAKAQGPDYRRHTSPALQRFGSDEAFLRYIAEARGAAHARGDWWYRDPDNSTDDEEEEEEEESPAEPESESDGEEAEEFVGGLEVIPGSHGEYEVADHLLPDRSLLFYSKLDLTQIRPGAEVVWPGFRPRGTVSAGEEPGGWESMRRQLAHAARNPLYALRDIYRPVRDTLESTVHAITLCSNEAISKVRPDLCRTTAFVAPRGGNLLVTKTHAYLWTISEHGDLEALRRLPDCRARAAALNRSGLPSQIYRLPLHGGRLEVLGLRGHLAWGSELHAELGRLRALAASPRMLCGDEKSDPVATPPARLDLLDVPLTRFARRLREAPTPVAVPQVGTSSLMATFVGDWLLYGARAYDFAVPRKEEPARTGRLVAVPLARPLEVRTLELDHDVVSLGRAGGHAVVAGYRDSGGTELGVVALGLRPGIVSRAHVPGRRLALWHHERIDARPGPDGSLRIALPTLDLDRPRDPYDGMDPRRHSVPLYYTLTADGRLRPEE